MAEDLAINGGAKAVTNELAGWPQFDEKAIKSVEEVLRSGKVNYWTGPRGMEFEKKFAAWHVLLLIPKFLLCVAGRR